MDDDVTGWAVGWFFFCLFWTTPAASTASADMRAALCNASSTSQTKRDQVTVGFNNSNLDVYVCLSIGIALRYNEGSFSIAQLVYMYLLL